MAESSSEAERYLQQLERTILHAASTGSPESSRQLDVERCQNSPDGLASACLELLRRRGWTGSSSGSSGDGGGISTPSVAGQQHYDAVAFYALTTLQRSPLLRCQPPSDNTNFSTLRNQLRRILLTGISDPINLQSMPNFVATKIGVLLALLVREEYPVDWACPWRDVLSALNLSSPLDGNHDANTITLGKMASMNMYLSFLDAVSDEIVYPSAADEADGSKASDFQRERIRREQVKDAIRGFPILSTIQTNYGPMEPSVPLEHTDIASYVVGWLLNALRLTASTTISDEMVLSIAVRATATLKRYLSWIDLRLATDRTLMHAILDGLGGASRGSSDDEDPTRRTMLAVECAYCLREIVDRGMGEQKKLALLTELDIFGVLCRFARLDVGNMAPTTSDGRYNIDGKLDLVTSDATQIEAVAAAAELINTSGLELIQGWELDPSPPTTNLQMGQCLELAMACLAYDSIDVSGAVVDLVSRILVSLEKKEEHWNILHNATASGGNGNDTICNKIMARILSILHMRMKYPAVFQFDYEDEEEAEEEIYRTQLRKLYQRIVRLRPQIALRFVGQCLSSLPQPLSSSPTPDLEGALRLVYHYGEGRRPAPGAKTALKDGPFREMVTALHRSDVASHPHREVLLLYYDVSVRYSAILKDTPELLALFLGSISGGRGLQHPHTRVRCRCCYLLLRLVKSVGAKTMRPHVEAIVDGIQGLLFPPPTAQSGAMMSIPPSEALYLFEATGILLGQTGLDAAVQVRCATAVLTPHIRSIEQTLLTPELTHDLETYGEQLSMSISAIAQLSKGWSKHPPPEVQSVLAATVDVCRNVLVALPSSASVRNRTAVLLQRMILCLGEGILPAMPSFFAPLLENCTSEEDVLDASQLMNQLCIKFKEKMIPCMDSAVLPFLQRVLAIQPTEMTVGNSNIIDGSTVSGGISPPPHLITEQLSIRKQAFSTLQHIALHNVDAVLYSETNMASLGDVLQLMNDGATTVPDPLMNKVCAQFFCELIKRWGCDVAGRDQQSPGPPPTTVTDAFFDFVYSVSIPGMMRHILDVNFNVKDALHCRVLAEFGRALWLLKQSPRRGHSEFHSRVVELFVLGQNVSSGNRKGSPDVIANGFQNASCGKDMEAILKAWKEDS